MHFPLLIGLGIALAMSPATATARVTPVASSAADNRERELPVVEQQQQKAIDTNPAGRVAQSSVSQLDQRQIRDIVAKEGIKPMGRIASRIQNRIRNRIDRNYDPQANATDPFTFAEDQARTTGREAVGFGMKRGNRVKVAQ